VQEGGGATSQSGEGPHLVILARPAFENGTAPNAAGPGLPKNGGAVRGKPPSTLARSRTRRWNPTTSSTPEPHPRSLPDGREEGPSVGVGGHQPMDVAPAGWGREGR